jgi:predicted HicB family RNase H-like nuclease
MTENYISSVLGINDVIGFEGSSVAELEQDFKAAIDDCYEI